MASISFDTATNGNFTAGTSHTFSHTCTGSNLILFVHAFHDAGTDLISGATYNGVAMTLVDKIQNGSSRYEYLFYLVGPATGANNVVISASSPTNIGGNASSYTNANQTGQIDASSKQLVQGATVNNIVTTVADNCWSILVTSTGSDVAVASTNSTLRVTNAIFAGEKIFDSNGAIHTAGSFTMTVTTLNTGNIAYVMASFSPFGQFLITGSQGSYTYTGYAAIFLRKILLATGMYTLTGYSMVMTWFQKWVKGVLNSSAFSNGSKNSSNWTDDGRDSSTFTNNPKN